jgi:hypothetical protein
MNQPLDVKSFFLIDANKFLFNNCPKNVKNLVKSAKQMQKVMGKLFWREIGKDLNGVRIRREKEAAANELLNEYIWKFRMIWMFTNLREGLSEQHLPHKAGTFQFKKNIDYVIFKVILKWSPKIWMNNYNL